MDNIFHSSKSEKKRIHESQPGDAYLLEPSAHKRCHTLLWVEVVLRFYVLTNPTIPNEVSDTNQIHYNSLTSTNALNFAWSKFSWSLNPKTTSNNQPHCLPRLFFLHLQAFELLLLYRITLNFAATYHLQQILCVGYPSVATFPTPAWKPSSFLKCLEFAKRLKCTQRNFAGCCINANPRSR